MPDLPPDWDIVSRRMKKSPCNPFDIMWLWAARLWRGNHADDRATEWTVRHRLTGAVRKLTARTELEARVKIANCLFDGA